MTTTIFGEIAELSPLPVIVHHLGYSADDGVARSRSIDRVHAARFVVPFRLWNDISVFCNSEVIGTSGFAVMLQPRRTGGGSYKCNVECCQCLCTLLFRYFISSYYSTRC